MIALQHQNCVGEQQIDKCSVPHQIPAVFRLIFEPFELLTGEGETVIVAEDLEVRDVAVQDRPERLSTRSDAAAGAAVASVDAARLKNVAQLYSKLGSSPKDAQARAVLFYSFIFGRSLLFLEQALRKGTNITAACADVLTDGKLSNCA